MFNQSKTPPPLLTDTLLAELANPDSYQVCGEFTAEALALLGTAVPEMARELLQRRSAAPTLAVHPQAARQSLDQARRMIRDKAPIHPMMLRVVCQTLLTHSTFADERAAASDILKQLEAA